MTSFLVFTFYYFTFAICLLFIISGIDDLLYDIIYWTSRLYGNAVGRESLTVDPIDHQKMLSLPERPIAIIIPCWHEDQVIEQMVANTVGVINYKNYDIFLGVYPNDEKTLKAASTLSETHSHLHVIVNDIDGPTTKGQNLNCVIRKIFEYEKKRGLQYAFFAFSDAEDVINPLELKLFNYFYGQFDLIQIPVLPLSVAWNKFVYWTYCDEFSEIHTKDLVVRDLIHGLVPTAGTGTALSRKCIQELIDSPAKQVFDPTMFTEDYDLAININLKGLKVAFIKEFDNDSKFKQKKHDGVIPWICIKEYFPDQYKQAVTQKARWIFGIVFQGWMKWGWEGSLLTKYCLFHDRKSIYSHFVNFAGYFVILIFIMLIFYPNDELITLFKYDSTLQWMLWACFFLMANRMLQRFIAVTTCYNPIQGLLSIPRIFYSNAINAHAFFRAFKLFFAHRKKQKIVWDKTDHTFPDLDKKQDVK